MNQNELKQKLLAAVERFLNDLKSLRTGRAHASIVDGVIVEVYGSSMPLKQIATISAPESQLLQITPFDPSNLSIITTAIRNNPSLGLNPSDDGRIIRIPIPPLTEERRRAIAKQIGEKVEECMVRMRAVRHEAIDAIEEAKKSKQIGEDEAKRLEKQVDEIMNQQRIKVEVDAKSKEQEIMKL